jgi:CHASE1-domain containing sensor protein
MSHRHHTTIKTIGAWVAAIAASGALWIQIGRAEFVTIEQANTAHVEIASVMDRRLERLEAKVDRLVDGLLYVQTARVPPPKARRAK